MPSEGDLLCEVAKVYELGEGVVEKARGGLVAPLAVIGGEDGG